MSDEYQILPGLWILESSNRLCFAIGDDGECKASTEYVEVDVMRAAIARQMEVLSYFPAGGAEDAAENANNPSLLRVMGGAMTGFSMAFPASPFDFVPPSRVTPEWVGWKVADTGWLPIDDDAAILKHALDAITAHFDEFIGECMAGAPSAKALARARGYLPAKCVNAFKKGGT